MAHVVGTTAYLETFPFWNLAGSALVAGKVNGDWTKKVKRNGATYALTVTVTEDADDAGYYAPSLTPDAAGDYTVILEIAHEGATRRFTESFRVVTAAQADPLAASTSGYAIGTLGNKVSTLGVSTAIVSEHVNIDGDRIELVRGDAYLDADGLAKTWTVTGVSVASATISFATFAGATAFSKAMTVSSGTLYVDLTSANTSGLTKGTPVYRYEVVATLSGGGTSTLFSGDVWVTD